MFRGARHQHHSLGAPHAASGLMRGQASKSLLSRQASACIADHDACTGAGVSGVEMSLSKYEHFPAA